MFVVLGQKPNRAPLAIPRTEFGKRWSKTLVAPVGDPGLYSTCYTCKPGPLARAISRFEASPRVSGSMAKMDCPSRHIAWWGLCSCHETCKAPSVQFRAVKPLPNDKNLCSNNRLALTGSCLSDVSWSIAGICQCKQKFNLATICSESIKHKHIFIFIYFTFI